MKSTTVAGMMTTRSMTKMTTAIKAKKKAEEEAKKRAEVVVNNQGKMGNKNESENENKKKEIDVKDKHIDSDSDSDSDNSDNRYTWVHYCESEDSENLIDVVKVLNKNILPFKDFVERFGMF